MKEIPKKNYYILVVLLVVTAVLTLTLSNVYLNREQLTSHFYKYSNKITPEEFDLYMQENPDVIIYISDKYDLTHETFEKKFQEKIDNLNLKQNLIYIDKAGINKKILSELKKSYRIDVDLKRLPTVVVISDKKVLKNVTINSTSNVDIIIEEEDFE